MKIDAVRAHTIFDKLHTAYLLKDYPFDRPEATPPQIPENIPSSFKRGSREHALYLFKLCYWMRGGIDSHTATKALTLVYNTHPEIFDPQRATVIQTSTLSKVFREVGLGFNAKEISASWMSNLNKLKQKWQGDPRRLFSGIATYEDALERIQNRGKSGFKGFQEKMVSMLTYFYMDADIVDPWHFPIPVDFHVLRTVFAHEIAVPEKHEVTKNGFYTKEVLAAIRKLFYDYCVEKQVNPITLCEAVWIHSRTMCAYHPGNQSKVGERHGRKTELTPIERWSMAQGRTYEKTCGQCCIESTCRWCVPSAEYYIRGRIVIREKRDSPPQQNLFLISTDS